MGAQGCSTWLRWEAGPPSGGRIEALLAREPAEFQPHWHAEWSLGAILSGSCAFTCDGGRERALTGDMVVIPPRVVHAARARPPAFGMVMLYVPEHAVVSWLRRPPPHLGAHVWRGPGAAGRLRSALEARAIPEIAALLRTTVRACAPAGAQAARASADPRLRIGLQRLGRACASPSELARELGVSREHFQRLFRRELGLSPLQYGRAARLEDSKAQIRAGKSLADVAASLGFSDQAHFTRAFKGCYGVSPGRFRRPRGSSP